MGALNWLLRRKDKMTGRKGVLRHFNECFSAELEKFSRKVPIPNGMGT